MVAESARARLLVLAPSSRDAKVTSDILTGAGIPVETFHDLASLCEALAHGAGAVLVPEEAIHADTHGELAARLAEQPAWSDLPVLVLAEPGSPTRASLDHLGNVTLVDRPVRIVTLVSTVRTALRARARQYQLARYLEDRRRHEAALAQSEARYRAIGETLPFGAWSADATGRIDYLADTFLSVLGITLEEATVSGWHHRVVPEHQDRVRTEWARAIASGRVFDVECPVQTTDGTLREVLVRGAPTRDALGTVTGWVGMNLDVTDKRRLEGELARIGRLESVSLLAGGFAHDFNNILTAILANVSLVKRLVPPDSAAVTRVEASLRAGGQAQRLVRQLLTFAKGGSPMLRTLQLPDLLREAMGFALQGSAVRGEVSAPKDLWSVEADPGQLTQVLHNLVLNASQAMDGAGLVRITARNVELSPGSPLPLPPGRYVRIAVVDQGRGIPADVLAKVFDLFFTTRSKGSGLGLAIAHSVIQRHGGHITVRSQPGDGATFEFYLPASPGSDAAAAEDEPTPLAHGPRVLVMDDDAALREVARESLVLLGYEVEEAEDGAQAVERYVNARERGRPFALVMLDLTVPGGMGGKETIERLRALDPDIRAIVASGYSNDPVMANFAAYGFRAALAKPYDVEGLERVFGALLKDPSR